MPRKTVNVRANSPLELKDALDAVIRDAVLKDIRRVTTSAVDQEISKIFQFMAMQMLGEGNFKVIQPYIPRKWPDYTPKYTVKKWKTAHHFRWFLYGFNSKGQKIEDTLNREFRSMSGNAVIAELGKSVATISRNRDIITIRPATRLRWRIYGMEHELEKVGLISPESMRKLQDHRKSYRPMIGPVFQYFRTVRIPQAIRRALRNV